MQPDEIVRFYNTFAQEYDDVVLQGRDYVAFEKIPSWILPRLKGKGAHVLDLGCGTGLGALGFFQAGHSVTGIDITSKMIEKARKLPYQQLICQSLEEPLPLRRGYYDAAMMLGVMEFIQNPAAVFAEVSRVLKPKGLFGITVPEKLPKAVEEKVGIRTYQLTDVEKAFATAGFGVLYSESFQGFVSQGETVPYRGYLLQTN